MSTYTVRRLYFDDAHPSHNAVIATGLTLEQAQAHCASNDTRGPVLANGCAEWFDAYDAATPRDHTPEATYRRDVYDVATLFKWGGGPYVDVMPLGQAVEVINVWDHVTDRPTIDETTLRAVCDEWVDELDRRDWRHGYCHHLVPCDCANCRRKWYAK